MDAGSFAVALELRGCEGLALAAMKRWHGQCGGSVARVLCAKMQVKVELLGALRDRFAERFPGGRGELELPEGTTVAELLEAIGLGGETRCAVTVNDQVVLERSSRLSSGSKVVIIPPVAGGEPAACTGRRARRRTETGEEVNHVRLDGQDSESGPEQRRDRS